MQVVKEIPQGYKEWKPKYGPYSASRLITAKCPQRYFGQYVRGDRSIGFSQAASRGSAIHEICARITTAKTQGVSLTPVLVDQWVGEAIGRYPAAYEQVDMVKAAAGAYIGNPSRYVNATTKCEVPLAFRYFVEELMDDSISPKVLLLQEPYEIEGRPNPAAFIGGRIDQVSMDRVTNTITLLDHKSTPSAVQNEDTNFQMGVYAWFLHLLYPSFTIRTVIHYAHPDLNFYGSPVVWSKQELDDVGSYVITRIRAIESFEEFQAIPGKQCDYCHMVQSCDINLQMEEQRARGTIDLNVRSVQDAQRIAEQMHVVGKMYDDLQKTYKDGLEKFGITGTGVAIDGYVYKHKTMDEAVDWVATDFNVRDQALIAIQALTDPQLEGEARQKAELMSKLPSLHAVLAHYGVQPDEFKKWDSDSLKSLWRLDKPQLLERIKGYIVNKRNTKFGRYKI